MKVCLVNCLTLASIASLASPAMSKTSSGKKYGKKYDIPAPTGKKDDMMPTSSGKKKDGKKDDTSSLEGKKYGKKTAAVAPPQHPIEVIEEPECILDIETACIPTNPQDGTSCEGYIPPIKNEDGSLNEGPYHLDAYYEYTITNKSTKDAIELTYLRAVLSPTEPSLWDLNDQVDGVILQGGESISVELEVMLDLNINRTEFTSLSTTVGYTVADVNQECRAVDPFKFVQGLFRI